MLALCPPLDLPDGAALPSLHADARPYRVGCPPAGPCRVELATYFGWSACRAQCTTCHAADARGSSFAPDLALRMGAMPQRVFFAALDRGYLGSQRTMPPRGRDPN